MAASAFNRQRRAKRRKDRDEARRHERGKVAQSLREMRDPDDYVDPPAERHKTWYKYKGPRHLRAGPNHVRGRVPRSWHNPDLIEDE